MTNDDRRKSDADAEIEREIRQGRKFTAKDVLASLAGPGAMKGASPISPERQAEIEIDTWLGNNLSDHDGALRIVLRRRLKGSTLLLASLDRPLFALAGHFRSLLADDYLLKEIVREADTEWGRAMDERPHFEREGAPPHPDDPYTVEGVRRTLSEALERLGEGGG